MRSLVWRSSLTAVAVIVFLATGAAQQQPTFKTGTQIVPLYVTVTDSQKRLVPDLEKEDFQILDNDKPVEIVFFQNETQPITVIVMLDTSASMTGNLALLRESAEQFIIRLMPEDQARVGAFNDKIEFSAAFTNNRDELISALKELDYGNPTRLYDAVDYSLNELKGIEGRRVVVVFTDGEDTGSNAGLGHVLDRAKTEEVMIYAIGMESEFFNGVQKVRTRPDRGLRKLADETGGGYFELKKTDALGETFTRVAQELHSQYVLGFAPAADGRTHKLGVTVKKPGMNARARKTYQAARGGTQ
jgi:Ca-activated chloride channel homolog